MGKQKVEHLDVDTLHVEKGVTATTVAGKALAKIMEGVQGHGVLTGRDGTQITGEGLLQASDYDKLAQEIFNNTHYGCDGKELPAGSAIATCADLTKVSDSVMKAMLEQDLEDQFMVLVREKDLATIMYVDAKLLSIYATVEDTDHRLVLLEQEVELLKANSGASVTAWELKGADGKPLPTDASLYTVAEVDGLIKGAGGGASLQDIAGRPLEDGEKIPTYEASKKFAHNLKVARVEDTYTLGVTSTALTGEGEVGQVQEDIALAPVLMRADAKAPLAPGTKLYDKQEVDSEIEKHAFTNQKAWTALGGEAYYIKVGTTPVDRDAEYVDVPAPACNAMFGQTYMYFAKAGSSWQNTSVTMHMNDGREPNGEVLTYVGTLYDDNKYKKHNPLVKERTMRALGWRSAAYADALEFVRILVKDIAPEETEVSTYIRVEMPSTLAQPQAILGLLDPTYASSKLFAGAYASLGSHMAEPETFRSVQYHYVDAPKKLAVAIPLAPLGQGRIVGAKSYTVTVTALTSTPRSYVLDIASDEAVLGHVQGMLYGDGDTLTITGDKWTDTDAQPYVKIKADDKSTDAPQPFTDNTEADDMGGDPRKGVLEVKITTTTTAPRGANALANLVRAAEDNPMLVIDEKELGGRRDWGEPFQESKPPREMYYHNMQTATVANGMYPAPIRAYLPSEFSLATMGDVLKALASTGADELFDPSGIASTTDRVALRKGAQREVMLSDLPDLRMAYTVGADLRGVIVNDTALYEALGSWAHPVGVTLASDRYEAAADKLQDLVYMFEAAKTPVAGKRRAEAALTRDWMLGGAANTDVYLQAESAANTAVTEVLESFNEAKDALEMLGIDVEN